MLNLRPAGLDEVFDRDRKGQQSQPRLFAVARDELAGSTGQASVQGRSVGRELEFGEGQVWRSRSRRMESSAPWSSIRSMRAWISRRQ
jgi:hypothetical protein